MRNGPAKKIIKITRYKFLLVRMNSQSREYLLFIFSDQFDYVHANFLSPENHVALFPCCLYFSKVARIKSHSLPFRDVRNMARSMSRTWPVKTGHIPDINF